MPSLSGIRVMDTTGALWKLLAYDKSPQALNEEELRAIVTFACTSAGLSTTRSGGISSIAEYGGAPAADGSLNPFPWRKKNTRASGSAFDDPKPGRCGNSWTERCSDHSRSKKLTKIRK